jgi:pilus assembly protein CpaB
MRARTLLTTAIAVFFGLIAVFLVQNYLGNARRAVAKAGQTGSMMPVVVAAQPIARGMTLTPDLLKVVNYPVNAVPNGSMQTLTAFSGGKTSARIALRSLAPNEPVLAGRITAPGARNNLSAALGEGMRAVSLRSGEVAGVGGFVLPEDHVDILVTRSVEGGANSSQNTVTQLLGENIRVLAVDQSDNDESVKPVVSRVVTVEVTPDQAQAISLAQAVGQVSLALRQDHDNRPLDRQITRVADLGKQVTPVNKPVLQRVRVRAAKPKAEVQGTTVHVTRGVVTTAYEMVAAL